MEKLFLLILFISINFGLYWVFVVRRQLKVVIAFLVFFLILVFIGTKSTNSDFQLIIMNFNLMMLYLLGLIVFKVLFPIILKFKNRSFPEGIRDFIRRYLVSGLTIVATLVQILMLFELLGNFSI